MENTEKESLSEAKFCKILHSVLSLNQNSSRYRVRLRKRTILLAKSNRKSYQNKFKAHEETKNQFTANFIKHDECLSDLTVKL